MQYFSWLVWISYGGATATAFYHSGKPARNVQGSLRSIHSLLGRTSPEPAAGSESARTSGVKLSIKRKAPPVSKIQIEHSCSTDVT